VGCYDQWGAHRLRRFSSLLIVPIATVGPGRPCLFYATRPPRGDEKPAASGTLT
jgi:hypothetical protein